MTDPETWSSDRVHGSPRGHALFAAAAAEALGLPGSNHDWATARPDATRPGLRSRMYSQGMWAQNLLMPWLWRHFRGLSSGNGRGPKRPVLEDLGVLRTCGSARAGQRPPSRPSGIGDCPLPIARPRRGRTIEMARPVNIVAGPSDMPATSATWRRRPRRSGRAADSIGHTD